MQYITALNKKILQVQSKYKTQTTTIHGRHLSSDCCIALRWCSNLCNCPCSPCRCRVRITMEPPASHSFWDVAAVQFAFRNFKSSLYVFLIPSNPKQSHAIPCNPKQDLVREPALSPDYKCLLWLKSAGNGNSVHSFIEPGLFLVREPEWDQFVRGVTDDNLNPLTCQPNPIGRLGEQKYGIRNTENMESEGGKICKCGRGEGSNCTVSPATC